MKLRAMVASMVLAFLVVGGLSQAHAATCTPTGFVREGINLTAAVIQNGGRFGLNGQTGGDLDATGCNIGIYATGGATVVMVNGAKVHGANFYGIVLNGAERVNITLSQVYQIGEVPFNGVQHGVAIYCAPESDRPISGRIDSSTVSLYQKGGIVFNGANCNSGNLNVFNTQIVGNGPVNYIAQNGLQVAGNSGGVYAHNSIIGHTYTGPNNASSGGILALGGDCFGYPLQQNNRFNGNELTANDVGIYDLNLDSSCTSAPSTPTNNIIADNDIYSPAVLNTTGNGSAAYQFGLSIAASGDIIRNNSICGPGYDPDNQPSGGAVGVMDLAGSGTLKISGTVCRPRGALLKLAPTDTTASSDAPRALSTPSHERVSLLRKKRKPVPVE